MPTRPQLTGRRGYRVLKRWLRQPVLVLQLEVKGVTPTNDGGRVEWYDATWWVDASPEHILHNLPERPILE